MPIPKEYDPILTKLEKTTAEGRVNWQLTRQSGAGDVFVAFNNYSVRMWWYQDVGDEEPAGIALGLMNATGERIDGFALAKGDEGFTRLESLFGKANRAARNVEKTLHDLVQQLDNQGPIGREPGFPKVRP